jgi:hypothetical protein
LQIISSLRAGNAAMFPITHPTEPIAGAAPK